MSEAKHPPIVCRPWCAEGHGHGDEHPIDQRCRTEYLPVPRSLAALWQAGQHWNEQVTEVYALTGPEQHPQVLIYDHGAHDIEIRLTAAEARTMAQHLLRCADLLDEAR